MRFPKSFFLLTYKGVLKYDLLVIDRCIQKYLLKTCYNVELCVPDIGSDVRTLNVRIYSRAIPIPCTKIYLLNYNLSE